MRIGERLIAAGVVAAEHIDECLRAQVVNGGRLGTNLVERCFVRMDELAQALAGQHGLPAALTHHFEDTDFEIQQRLSPELAAEWHVVPLGEVAGGAIAVATTDPLPPEAVAEIAEAVGAGPAGIVTAIAPELRILYWLERRYGIRRPNRYRRTRADSGEIGERRQFVEPLDSEGAQVAPAPGALAKIAVRRVARSMPAEAEPDEVADAGAVEAATRALRRATGRDRVAEVVLGTLRDLGGGAIDVAMILILRDTLAIGWRGFARGGDDDRVEALAIPTTQPGIIHSVARCAAPVRGLDVETALDRALWNHLAVAPPTDVLAMPILLFSRLAGFLYVHSRAPLDVTVVAELFEVADAMTAAFERLVRAARR